MPGFSKEENQIINDVITISQYQDDIMRTYVEVAEKNGVLAGEVETLYNSYMSKQGVISKNGRWNIPNNCRSKKSIYDCR